MDAITLGGWMGAVIGWLLIGLLIARGRPLGHHLLLATHRAVRGFA